MFLFLLVVLLLHSSHSYEVGHGQNWTFVDSKSPVQNDVAKCISGGPEFPCHSLRYAAEQSVKFMGSAFIALFPEIQLNDSIEFKNASNIKIIGSQKATITCTSNKAGFAFDSVNGIHIANVTIQKCGMYSERNLKSAITVDKCRDVTMRNVVIKSSNGAALAFFDTYGEIQIYDARFEKNGVRWSGEQLYAGAVYVSFNQCLADVYSSYTFQKSTFKSNRAVVLTTEARLNGTCSGLGGGLGLFFTRNSCSNVVKFVKCTFQTNRACWGGGMYVGFMDQSRNNSVLVINTKFIQNFAKKSGGGADIGYINSTLPNHVYFSKKTLFTANEATYGGGTGIFASTNIVYSEPGNITFDNCRWEKNSAYFSSAVDISPYIKDTVTHGFLPVPVFTNCRFIANRVKRRFYYDTVFINEGSFTVTRFKVQFGRQVLFQYHRDTALHVSSGIIEFLPGTKAWFYKNSGIKGGAIALYGYSSFNFQNKSFFRFTNNTAVEAGGAIYYHPFDQHDFVATQSCFMQYVGPKTTYNVTFVFKGNRVSGNHSGYSIYALTLYPCYFQLFDHFDKDKHPLPDGLLSRASFRFDTPLQDALATAGAYFRFNNNSSSKTFYVIPGNKLKVPLSVIDEMKSAAHTVYRVSTTGKLKADRIYTVHRKVRIYGKPYQNDKLTFTSSSFRAISSSVTVYLLQCPPGFFLKGNMCQCASYSEKYTYLGIGKCQYPEFQAYATEGYWIGYIGKEMPDNLYTAPCPLGFCNDKENSNNSLLPLPSNASDTALTDLICGKHRMGKLCGECRNGFSVYYHSQNYKCGDSKHCNIGLLFYFLSEIVPLAVFFTIVIVFDIRFTSGTANGFIFFSQVLDSLSVDAKGAIQLPSLFDKLSIGYRIIYGLFNFDFFCVDSLSFCLWKQATVLDTLAFKYITIAFAFGLVVCLVVIIHYCQCRKACALKKKFNAKDSVIHGLSAFLVMCYAQCTKVSFQILTSVTLTGKGGTPGPQVSGFGGIPYFQGKHLAYAIPACVCLTTIVAIPPTLLIVFPLVLQLLALCGLNESKAANWVSLHIWTSKLKTVQDSFQACFKGKLRFFAGFYFVYRVAILAAYAFSKTTIHFYIAVEVLLVLMLGLHAVAQPYEKRRDNIFDALIFINLALINAFTIFNEVHRSHSGEKKIANAVLWFQMILIHLPIVFLCISVAAKIAKEWKARATVRQLQEEFLQLDSLIDHERLPYQEFESSVLQQSESTEQESLL